ncbi:TIGR00300 family protein [Desulfacinum infernum DSM 9756]|uniref:TIGR00300 family protein n=2 Tax=Desulfacinum infernum TaxID=35837 RepID=A0A1M4XSU5_9BACT|nr:TIGR00300 family protein [Desulfacinum infernum DSM 9756]
MFRMPEYHPPDFSDPLFAEAPLVAFREVAKAGVAPEGYHATSVFPEYFHVEPGRWELLRESRMDCVVVQRPDGCLDVVEFRRLQPGDRVAVGRGENAEEGIYVHADAFQDMSATGDKFAFRTRLTRETSFSIDYDEFYDLLSYERDHGTIVWVLGPAVVFDQDARSAFASLIRHGYVHALLAGNALATHDLEGALFGTALGQEIYSKRSVPLGHYHHLDAINRLREVGSIEEAIRRGMVKDGVMHAAVSQGIPVVLAGSIRDDGPLPGVIADAYEAQDRMRDQVRRATTIVALATQLHAIATGNMAPSYRVLEDGTVRPVFFYTVDMSEFAVQKLANRGSLTARSILTNVQDFVVTVERGLRRREEG